jgi:uncharacterized protein (TIGR02271 family)
MRRAKASRVEGRSDGNEASVDTLATTTAARFTDPAAAGDAVVELVRLKTPPQRLRVAMRDARAQRTFATRYGIAELPHPGGRGGIAAALERITGPESEGPRPTLADALVGAGFERERAGALERALGPDDVLLIVPEDAPAAALGALVRHRADLGTGVLQYVIPLRAERLAVGKHAVVENEVVVRTDVISEVRTFEVSVEREEFVIERRRFGTDGRPGELETTRIPLRHEEVVVTKRTVVTEEIDVRKERFVEVERVSGTVRHEELRIEADPGARVRFGEGVLRSEPGARSS